MKNKLTSLVSTQRTVVRGSEMLSMKHLLWSCFHAKGAG